MAERLVEGQEIVTKYLLLIFLIAGCQRTWTWYGVPNEVTLNCGRFDNYVATCVGSDARVYTCVRDYDNSTQHCAPYVEVP